MAAITMLEDIKVYLKLNAGTTTTGKVKTIPVSIGNLSKTGYDDDKAVAVASLIGACLKRSVYEVQKVATYQLEND